MYLCIANCVVLQLYLWHDFYNMSFKIKLKLYIASGSSPPPPPKKKKNPGVHVCRFRVLQFLLKWYLVHCLLSEIHTVGLKISCTHHVSWWKGSINTASQIRTTDDTMLCRATDSPLMSQEFNWLGNLLRNFIPMLFTHFFLNKGSAKLKLNVWFWHVL